MNGVAKRFAVVAFAGGMTLMVGVAAAGMMKSEAMMKGEAMKAMKSGPVAERQAAMKAAKKNFKALVGMVKGEMAFDAAAVKRHAQAIEAALKKAKMNFPEGTDEGDTRAKPEIWLMKDEFNAQFDKAISLAKTLEMVNTKDKLAPAVMALGKNGCKACHMDYRLPKKEKK